MWVIKKSKIIGLKLKLIIYFKVDFKNAYWSVNTYKIKYNIIYLNKIE